MVLALVIVAGTAMAQTSVTPYRGAKYNYTIGGIDAGSTTRLVKIYYTTDAAPGTKIAAESATSITVSNVVCTPSATPSITFATPDETFVLPIGTTSFSFDAAFGATVALAQSRIWVEIYNDAAGTECHNTMYLNVTPVANTLDFRILASNATQCPTTTTPTSQQTDAVNNTTEIVYTITRIDGNNNYDWSFNLGMAPGTFGPATETVTVAYSVGAGSIVSGSGFGAEIKIRGTNTVTATITVANNPGVADQDFVGTLSSMTQYVNQTTVVNSNSDLTTANNTATTTLKEIPSIGTFSGN